ncbi:uncharacterized protein F54H12.2-like [Amphiura filiformis]|uniref:uncharacterized protein F54H12.2-like n=1 Tax=Amphiura filiformis TaxID=82378 RepID=UPI003B22581A
MAFVHDHSAECTSSQLDIFSLPPTQTSILQGHWVSHHPVTTIADNGPLEFVISGNEEYLSLSDSYLQISAKITGADGTDIEDASEVGPVNLFLHSLFSQVDVSLNGRLVSQSSSTYAYRALLESLLNYGQDATTTQLTSAMFYKDTAGNMEATNPGASPATSNTGLKNRSKFTDGGKTVDMVGRLHSDIFMQDRYLLNSVDVKIKLHRSKDEFCLMASDHTAGYKVKILDAILHVRKAKLNPGVALAHAKGLERATAKYPVSRVLVKTFTVPAGDLSITKENVFLGQLPKRIILGFVANAAFNGHYKRNPYNFKHYSVNKVGVYVDGMLVPMSESLNPNFAGESGYIAAFNTLFTGLNKHNKDNTGTVNRADYKRGYTLMCFDLTADLCDFGHFNLQKTGNLRLELQFADALPETINVLVYAEFENVIQIDKSRNVIYDYGST